MRKLAQDWMRGWGKTFLSLSRSAFKQAKKAELPTMAGSLAYTTVLSIAPLLAVFFYVFKIFGGLEYAYKKLMPFLLDILSEGTGEVVEEHLYTFVRQVHAKTVGWIGIAALMLTSVMTYLTILKAFNRIWEVDHPRKVTHSVLRALTLLTIGPLLLTASLAITTALAARIKAIPYSGHLVAYALSATLFTIVYALVPMVKIPLRIVVIGSLLPAFLLEAAKVGYAMYTSHIVTYSKFYGSFAAIPLFLLWIYIAWYITLFGAVWVRALQLKGNLHARP